MLSDVEVQDFAAASGDHKPDEQHLEADCRHDQKIHCRDRVAMVSK
jgi:hypothetical protein